MHALEDAMYDIASRISRFPAFNWQFIQSYTPVLVFAIATAAWLLGGLLAWTVRRHRRWRPFSALRH